MVCSEVNALPEPDGLTILVELKSEHEQVWMLREFLRQCWYGEQAEHETERHR